MGLLGSGPTIQIALAVDDPLYGQSPYAGDDAASGRAGKLMYLFVQLDDGEHTLVEGWSDDGASEIVQVDLVGHHALNQNDFIGAH